TGPRPQGPGRQPQPADRDVHRTRAARHRRYPRGERQPRRHRGQSQGAATDSRPVEPCRRRPAEGAGLHALVPVPAEHHRRDRRQLGEPASDARSRRHHRAVEPSRRAGRDAGDAGCGRRPRLTGPARAARCHGSAGRRGAVVRAVLRWRRRPADRREQRPAGRHHRRTDRRADPVISRGTRLKVLVFLVVSLAGTAFVGLRYVGLGDRLFGGTYLVHADFATAGGIFPNASVTYRGVPVGRVDAVRLHGGTARVELRLQRGVRVPADLHAVVAQRSAVGEQYVDLRPDTDSGPYLRGGDVIPTARTGTPLPVETLLANLDALVGSVNPRDLTVLIDELGAAFEGNETALRRLLDANSALLEDANRYLPQTVALIRDGQTVLATQVAEADAIRRWAAALAQFTETLRTADPDLRRLLAAGPPAAAELASVLHGLDPDVGPLLGNLITVNGIAVRRLDGIDQFLV